MLAVYVSGHGFGHATRTAEVLRAVRERASGAADHASARRLPSFLFEGVVGRRLSVRLVECDVGLVQKDALTIDEAGDAPRRVRRFLAGWDGLVAREARWLRESGRAARARRHPAARVRRRRARPACLRSRSATSRGTGSTPTSRLASRPCGEAAAHARRGLRSQPALLLRLPFAGDLSAFPRIEDVPLVARAPRAREGRGAPQARPRRAAGRAACRSAESACRGSIPPRSAGSTRTSSS